MKLQARPKTHLTEAFAREPNSLKDNVVSMVSRSINEFPELSNRRITIGLTRAYDGSAGLGSSVIRLNPKNLRFFTVGHELTHLLQGNGIPFGEKARDIYTIARSSLFLDAPPGYLRISRNVERSWNDYSNSVQEFCRRAIEYRKSHRKYIMWLEANLVSLGKRQARKSSL